MFEYGMNEHLKNLQEEIKRCAFSLLIDNGYTDREAQNAIEKIKNFNVYEIETGYKIESLVDNYKVIVFHHKGEVNVTFYDEESKEQTDKERIQKLENRLSDLLEIVPPPVILPNISPQPPS